MTVHQAAIPASPRLLMLKPTASYLQALGVDQAVQTLAEAKVQPKPRAPRAPPRPGSRHRDPPLQCAPPCHPAARVNKLLWATPKTMSCWRKRAQRGPPHSTCSVASLPPLVSRQGGQVAEYGIMPGFMKRGGLRLSLTGNRRSLSANAAQHCTQFCRCCICQTDNFYGHRAERDAPRHNYDVDAKFLELYGGGAGRGAGGGAPRRGLDDDEIAALRDAARRDSMSEGGAWGGGGGGRSRGPQDSGRGVRVQVRNRSMTNDNQRGSAGTSCQAVLCLRSEAMLDLIVQVLFSSDLPKCCCSLPPL